MIARLVLGAFLLICAARAGSGENFKPGQTFKDCAECPEMIVVPGGSFTMGSPENEPQRENSKAGIGSPLHQVTIAAPLAVGRFSVTRDEFEAFVVDSGYKIGGSSLSLWQWRGWVPLLPVTSRLPFVEL